VNNKSLGTSPYIITYFCIALLSFTSHAKPVQQYFENDDSVTFSNDQLKSSNRQHENPLISVKHFDISKLLDSAPEGIEKEILEEIISKDQKDNNQRYNIDRLELLAQKITQYYRQQGYILSKAYFPKQNLINTGLSLDIVYGNINKVTAVNHDHYSQSRITKPFESLLGKPTHVSSLESSLLELNQYPGLTTKSRFRKSDDVGQTQIDIFVTDEKISDFNLRFDNYGSKYTGSMRGMLTAELYNVADMADKLSLNMLATIEPSNSLYVGAEYSMRWSPRFNSQALNNAFKHGLITKVGYQESQYVVGGEFKLAQIEGTANTIYTGVGKHLILQNDLQVFSEITFSQKQAASYQNDRTQIQDKLSVLKLSGNISWHDFIGSPSANSLQVDYSMGLPGVAGSYGNNAEEISRIAPDGETAPMDFSKINLLYMRNQAVGPYQLLSKVNIQATNDLLLSSELSNLGGPSAVRGYRSSDFSGDRTTALTLEFSGTTAAHTFSIPISDLKLAAFADYGIGERIKPDSNVLGDTEMLSIGGYAQFLKEGSFSSKIEIAVPMMPVGNTEDQSFEILFNFDRGF